MKLRIHKNSIRLRLSQPEVQQIGTGEPVHQLLRLHPGSSFEYILKTDTDISEVAAHINKNILTVSLPVFMAEAWALTHEVTIRYIQNEGSEFESCILIEKDFQCLHKRPDEDESANFINPNA